MSDWIAAERASLLQFIDTNIFARSRAEQDQLRADYEQYKSNTESQIRMLQAELAEANNLRAENAQLKQRLQQVDRGLQRPPLSRHSSVQDTVQPRSLSEGPIERHIVNPTGEVTDRIRGVVEPPDHAGRTITARKTRPADIIRHFNSLKTENSELKQRNKEFHRANKEAASSHQRLKDLVQEWAVYADSLETRHRHCQVVRDVAAPIVARPNAIIPEFPEAAPSGPECASLGGPADTPRTSASFTTSTSSGDSSMSDVSPAGPRLSQRRPATGFHARSPVDYVQRPFDKEPHLPMLPLLAESNATAGQARIKEEPSSDEPTIVLERPIKKRRHDGRAKSASPQRAPRLKVESSDSDPFVTGENTVIDPHLSQDLDLDSADLPTPRKRRRLAPLHFLIREDSFTNPARQRPSTTRDPAAPRRSLDTTISNGRQHSALRDISTNQRLESRKRHKNSGEYRQSSDQYTGGKEIRVLGSPDPAPIPLADMLNTKAATEAAPALRRPDKRSSHHVRSENDSRPGTRGRASPLGQHSSKAASASDAQAVKDHEVRDTVARDALVEPSTLRRSLISARKQPRPPLRELPVESLSLADFKINPVYNNGSSVLVSEVVRDKSDRRNMAGCVSKQCCGPHFRKLAASELKGAGPSLLYSAQSVKLLEDFLGDEAFKLGPMNREEREAIWLEAKTHDLANKIGKCRSRGGDRAESPPGFWDPDFPSTQEFERNRREGQQMDLERIRERRREAMRHNGRWIFRDEVQ